MRDAVGRRPSTSLLGTSMLAATLRGVLASGVCLALACGNDDASSTRASDAAGQRDARVADASRQDAAQVPGMASTSADAGAAIPICGELTNACPNDASVLEPTPTDAGLDTGDTMVSCDPRPVLCKKAPPKCSFGWVPAVLDACYGDCVRVERCACTEADACPEREQYVCHMSAGHCGPYVH